MLFKESLPLSPVKRYRESGAVKEGPTSFSKAQSDDVIQTAHGLQHMSLGIKL